jgi:protein SCO1/2
VALAGLAAACAPYQPRGAAFDPPIPAPEFRLTDQHGQPFELASLAGRVVLVTFGYTACPDVCPATLAIARQALHALGPAADEVSLVFVSVDPLRDSPPVLEAFLAQFSPDFIGVTGDPVHVAEVLQDFGIEAQPVLLAASGYSLEHTGRTYLIDRSGLVRVQYPVGVTDEDLTPDLRHFLGQP